MGGRASGSSAPLLEAIADRPARPLQGATPEPRQGDDAGGLWRYSRHPNYFFQWLTWVAYALVALAAPWGWVGFLTPAIMLFLILFVTGIPPREERLLRSRGDDYRRYQRETSAFVPWSPRERQSTLRSVPRVSGGIRATCAAGSRGSAAGPGREASSSCAARRSRSSREKPNEQHYEVPPELFRLVLGPRLKYTCCYWPTGSRRSPPPRRRCSR